jgi:hypothetical protein
MERLVGHVVSRFLVFYVRKYKGYRRCRVEWMNLSAKFREVPERGRGRAAGRHKVIT